MREELITTVIIEDEREARLLLSGFLKLFDELEVIGEATNAKEALDIIRFQSPDLLFIDIDLPDTSGIELSKIIREEDIPCQIIFTTAHAEKAIDTFDVEPLDFLTKPFGPPEIEQVLSRFKQIRSKIGRTIPLDPIEKIRIPTKSGFIFIRPEEIVYCHAQKATTQIVLVTGEEEDTSVSFGRLFEYLEKYQFLKVSRSALINLKYLRRVDKKKKICQLYYNDKIFEVEISRNSMKFFDNINFFTVG
ncbi:MAG: LytTR family DNA-binding domain-containing protein [Bacteroidota bacterium]|nr:LytTR family DNA-binding domain-containing protein [Bacteroidota bacterium]MDP4206673.1 LytTR family DNA-binding domain-containing protein [Bacteroidota bacterium]